MAGGMETLTLLGSTLDSNDVMRKRLTDDCSQEDTNSMWTHFSRPLG